MSMPLSRAGSDPVGIRLIPAVRAVVHVGRPDVPEVTS